MALTIAYLSFALVVPLAPAHAQSVVHVSMSNLTFVGAGVCGAGTAACTETVTISFDWDVTTASVVSGSMSTFASGAIGQPFSYASTGPVAGGQGALWTDANGDSFSLNTCGFDCGRFPSAGAYNTIDVTLLCGSAGDTCFADGFNGGHPISGTFMIITGPAPTVNLLTACVNGLQIDINGVASPGASVTSISWNWGDGTTTTGFFPQSHTYSSSGPYNVQVKANYNNGSSASASQMVSVGPGILSSSCVALTITAGQGGTVGYSASVGSNLIPEGSSITLYLDSADDLQLTVSPSIGYSFSSWLASNGVTGASGSAVNTTSPSILIVVTSNSVISASFASDIIGVRNTITLNSYSVVSSTNCPVGASSCSSIQQNFEIEVPGQAGSFTYLAQNVIQIEQLAGINIAVAAYNLRAPNGSLIEGQTSSLSTFAMPATWTMTTQINSSNQLVFTTPFAVFTAKQPMPTGAKVKLGPNVGAQLMMPELVIVGIGSGTAANPAATVFGNSTSGSVQSFLETSAGLWSSALTLVSEQYTNSESLESSSGLQWNFTGSNAASFGAPGGPAEGIGFVPGGPAPVALLTIQGGQTAVDEVASTGISVTLAGSTAPNGTQVSVSTQVEGGSQPPGTGQLRLGSAAFFDVKISFPMNVSPDGTATVCISPVLTSQTATPQTVMQYWNNGSFSWVNADNQTFTNTPTGTFCGTIPAASLSGTPVKIAPVSTTSSEVHLVANFRSLTLTSARDEFVVLVSVTNAAGGTASNVTLTAATLNGTSTKTALPDNIGTLPYAGSATVTLIFPASAAAPGSQSTLKVSETYSGGEAEQIFYVTLPR